jgi:phosphinothricin acetyltransferase
MIRACRLADAAQICEIYNHHVLNTVVTFEEIPVSVEEMARRIGAVTEKWPWFVWEEQGAIAGYAYAGMWKERSAYRFSVESTVYVAENRVRRGIGAALYRALLPELKVRGAHYVIGGIALPNDASVALHEKLGFEKIGHFREVGFKHGRWVDVAYWQLVL